MEFKALSSKKLQYALEADLNQQATDGWELHSLVPQTDDNGETYCNVAVFVKEAE